MPNTLWIPSMNTHPKHHSRIQKVIGVSLSWCKIIKNKVLYKNPNPQGKINRSRPPINKIFVTNAIKHPIQIKGQL